MTSCIAAMTACSGAFPPYINVSVDDEGDIVITFRDYMGVTVDATFKPSEWAKFRREIIKNV